MNKQIKFLAAVAFGLVATSAAQAATTQTTFTVSADVLASCSVSASNMGFGTVDTLSATPTDTTSAIDVTCSSGTAYTVDLGATPEARTMTAGANSLNYGMWQDAARTVAFTSSGTGDGTAQPHTVYGRVPGSQSSVPNGSYSDTVTVTVTY